MVGFLLWLLPLRTNFYEPMIKPQSPPRSVALACPSSSETTASGVQGLATAYQQNYGAWLVSAPERSLGAEPRIQCCSHWVWRGNAAGKVVFTPSNNVSIELDLPHASYAEFADFWIRLALIGCAAIILRLLLWFAMAAGWSYCNASPTKDNSKIQSDILRFILILS